MATQVTSKLPIVDDIPSVTKLWNGRFRLEFFCKPSDKKIGWYKENIDKWLPAFGALQDDALENGWEYPANQGVSYDDMRLVEASVPYVPSAGEHFIRLVYETLTSSLVAEVDDKIIESDNGLQITERKLIAKAGVEFTEEVGTGAYDGKTLIQSEVENTDAYTRVTARYSESGVISRSTDLVGSQQALVITSLGETPATPSGYSLAKTDVNNEEGFETTSYTFYENDSILSRSNDYVGSQLAEAIEVFNPSVEPTPTNAGAVLGNKSESNVDGIPTTRYTFLKPSVLSRSEETKNQGALLIETVEAFNETPVSSIGGVLISESTSDVEGIATTRYVFASGSGVISVTTDTKNQGALFITTTVSLGFASGSSNVSSSSRSEDGYTIYTNVGATGNGEISRTTEERNNGNLTIITVTALGSAVSGAGVLINSSDVKSDGHTVYTRTTATGSGEIDRTVSTHNQGKLIVTSATSLGSMPSGAGTEIRATSREENGYTLYERVTADGNGQVFVSQSAGPTNIPGTTRRTARAYGAPLIPAGVLIESEDIARDGFTEYVRTTLDGPIAGLKFQYPDVATVEVPGTVECTTQEVSEGPVSGTIAITKSTPRRQKQVATVVTVKISPDIPEASPRAYDLGQISCSVTSVQTKLQSGDGSVASVGNISQVGFQRNFASSASIQHYAGSYLTTPSSSGSVDYISSEQPYEDGGAIGVQLAESFSSSTCTGTGATEATGYVTSGIISRDVQPVLTTLNGTVYYQITTEEAQ